MTAADPRHRDEDRPTRYGPHFTRRAASMRRALERALVDSADPKETRR